VLYRRLHSFRRHLKGGPYTETHHHLSVSALVGSLAARFHLEHLALEIQSLATVAQKEGWAFGLVWMP